MESNPIFIYEWIRSFSKGDIIVLFLMGIAMFFYHKVVTKKMMRELGDIPNPNLLLTKEAHAVICRNTMLEIKNLLLENRMIAAKDTSDLKELLMVTMRADILEAIKNNKK